MLWECHARHSTCIQSVTSSSAAGSLRLEAHTNTNRSLLNLQHNTLRIKTPLTHNDKVGWAQAQRAAADTPALIIMRISVIVPNPSVVSWAIEFKTICISPSIPDAFLTQPQAVAVVAAVAFHKAAKAELAAQ